MKTVHFLHFLMHPTKEGFSTQSKNLLATLTTLKVPHFYHCGTNLDKQSQFKELICIENFYIMSLQAYMGTFSCLQTPRVNIPRHLPLHLDIIVPILK